MAAPMVVFILLSVIHFGVGQDAYGQGNSLAGFGGGYPQQGQQQGYQQGHQQGMSHPMMPGMGGMGQGMMGQDYPGNYPGFSSNMWGMNQQMTGQGSSQGTCPSPSSFSNQMSPMNPTTNMFGNMGWPSNMGGMSSNMGVGGQQGGMMNSMGGFLRKRRATVKTSSTDRAGGDIRELVDILPDEEVDPMMGGQPGMPNPFGGSSPGGSFMQQQAIPCQTHAQCGANRLCCPTGHGTKACMNPVNTGFGGGMNQPYSNFPNPIWNQIGMFQGGQGAGYPQGGGQGAGYGGQGAGYPQGGGQGTGYGGQPGMYGQNNGMMNPGMMGQGGQQMYGGRH